MRILTNPYAIVLMCTALSLGSVNASVVSTPRLLYQPVSIDVVGPDANESDVAPNPFLDIRFDLTLTSPSGSKVTVPGFFAGDGLGGGEGHVWRARFTPDELGIWQYTATLLSGTNAAVIDQTNDLTVLALENGSGEFEVKASVDDAPGFLKYGRLSYVGEHYLKLANGPYWIKSGLDSPENFFGYIGFDNTINQPGGVGEAQLPEGLHHYSEHVDDWQEGDPLFSSATSGIDSKGIIGAVNYLASEGVNSMYFLLMNLGGDGRDTYPFVGASGNEYDNTHYDISKLHQWNIVLEHMQTKGIAAHFVLGEQEQDNRLWLDNGELGNQRKLYYREMAARFAHLNAVKWNLSEESRYGDDRHKAFSQALRNVDWAQHPIAVHSFVDSPEVAYEPLLGDPLFTISSIQFSPENADEFTETWREKSSAAGVPWVIDMDEVGPADTGLTNSNSDQLRREVLYPVYFSGGNIEWYFGFQGADIRTENFRTHESMYRYMRIAREFMEVHLPFWEMGPDDDALEGGDANDQVFAKPGSVYAVYLNQGNNQPTLRVSAGDYTVQWFNPRNGEMESTIRNASGNTISLGTPPTEPQEDWVVLIKRAERVEPITPLEPGEQTEKPENTTESPTESGNENPNLGDNPELGAAQQSSGGGHTGFWFLLLLLAKIQVNTLANRPRNTMFEAG